MAKKPKDRPKAQDASDEETESKPRGSRKLLLAAAAMCLLSLGGGFGLARMAYLQDAKAFEPEYQSDADGKSDGHDKMDKGHGKAANSKLRDDITDPLAKDGHAAEKAVALQEKSKDTGKGKGGLADSGLLEFGDMLTDIRGIGPDGKPRTAFLKVNLVLAYRPDEGSGKLMAGREPFIRDLFNGYLRGLSEPDLRGMAGVLRVKSELLKRARAAVGSDLPQEVLINDLIVQ